MTAAGRPQRRGGVAPVRSGSVGHEYRTVLLLGLAFGCASYDRMVLTFLTPFVQAEFALRNVHVAALGAGLSLTWALGAFLIGRWSDRSGVRKPFLIAALRIFSACSALSGLSQGFWSLLASRVVMGAVEGPFMPICLAIVIATSARTRLGLNAGIVQNVFGSVLGAGLAPLLGVWIAQVWNWRAAFYTAALPGVALAGLVWWLVDEPRPAPPAEGESGDSGSIRALLAHRNLRLCAAISAAMVGAVLAGSIFMPLYLTTVRRFDPATMAATLAVLALCPPVGGIAAAWLSDRYGRRLPLILFCALTALWPLAALFYEGPPAMLAALMFVGLCGMGSFPLFMGTIPAETLSFRNTAAAMGLIVAVGELAGGVAIPLIAGRLADSWGLWVPLAIAAALALVAAGLATMLDETNALVLERTR